MMKINPTFWIHEEDDGLTLVQGDNVVRIEGDQLDRVISCLSAKLADNAPQSDWIEDQRVGYSGAKTYTPEVEARVNAYGLSMLKKQAG